MGKRNAILQIKFLQAVVYSQSVGLGEQEKNIYLGRIVDISAALQQNLRNVLVTVVGRDVQRREPALARHIGVVVVLQQQRGRLCVVFLGGDMQGGKADLNSKNVMLGKMGIHILFILFGIDNKP